RSSDLDKMANGLTGAAAGISAGESDIRAGQEHLLNMAMGGVKLEEAQIHLQQQKRIMQQLSQQQGLGDDPIADMYNFGKIYSRSGAPEQAKEFYSAASTMQKNASSIANSALGQVIKDSTIMSSLLENVHDDQ